MADEPASTAILARLIAERLHAGQVRLDGSDYFRHCERVASGVRDLGFHARAVAFLHDVLEDTAFGVRPLAAIFGPRVVADVVALTRCIDEPYADFIDRIARGSDTALMVKLSDVKDNLVGVPGRSLARRYTRAERVLREEAVRRGLLLQPPPKPPVEPPLDQK